MSEASFDTSAADTLTSGLSLGQFIKNVAEEAQPADSWYRLQPTVEKEWQTLQGESISQNTIVDDEMTELPLSDVSAMSAKQGFLNPIASLIKQSESQKQSEYSKQSSKLFPQPSTSLATPAVTSQIQPYKKPEKFSQDYFATPALSYQKPNTEKYSIVTTPLTSKPLQQQYTKANDSQLSAQEISSLLEKDDSLAQRVKDLLEDNASIRSEASEPLTKPANQQKIPTLLQSTSKDNKKTVEKQHSNCTTASEPEHDEHIVLSDASLCSTNEKSATAKVLNQTNPMMKTLNLFSDSGFNIGNLTDVSNLGDPLESLNASGATEYGDLPETVDIPPDIVQRLHNMRLISQQQQHKVDPLEQSNFVTTSDPDAIQALPVVSTTITSTNTLPISGDVRLHTGSNPTTPQFPIEKEKLKQLQSYIEKKTGVQTVSPLVVGTDIIKKSVQEPNSASKLDNQPTPVSKATLMTAGTSSAISSAGTSTLLAATPLAKGEIESVPTLASIQQGDATPNPSSNMLQFDSSQRCDPEGMSPPVNSTAASLAIVKAAVPTVQLSSSSETKQNFLPPTGVSEAEDESYLSENLTDESLLARIKLALSDSFSQQPDLLEKSSASVSSSIDSLAAHVKALLKEEVPKLVSTEDLETSNLSEVIENFEHTDLWKFVAQFMPSAAPVQIAGPLPRTKLNDSQLSSSEALEQDATLTDSGLDNSILERIRAEFKKSIHYVPSVDSATTSETDKSQPISHLKLVDSVDTSGMELPAHVTVKSVSSTQPQATPPVSTATNLHIIDEEPMAVDPIPGIPDFTPSVIQRSSPTVPFLGQSYQVKDAWPEKKFSHYKQNAKSMIANQLNRAAHRDFDVSLTPATHSKLNLSERLPPPPSTIDNYTSLGKKREISLSSSGKRSSPHPQSAYFTKRDVSLTSSATNTDNCTYDAVSSRASPSSSVGFPDQVERTSNRGASSRTKSSRDVTPAPSGMTNKSSSVTPKVSSGLPKSSKHVTLTEPHRSAPPRYYQQNDSFERRQIADSARKYKSQSDEFVSPKRRIPPLRERVSVQDWLRSPERKRKLEQQKHLPTFDELMEEEERKREEKTEKRREQRTAREMSSLQERNMNIQSSRKSSYSNRNPIQTNSENASKKLDFEKSSLRPQLDDNDSYQQASLNTAGLPAALSRSSLSEDSDVNIQRRMVNQALSDTEFKSRLKKIPKTVSEFQAMDEKSQQEFLGQVMIWVNQKRRTSANGESVQRRAAVTTSTSSSILSSNLAVCDSDSTEYCDLPSTPTATSFNTSSLLSMDEAKAEKLMKKLLERIKRQKESERPERKKPSHKRTAASSSTPQKRRPPLPVPEASSIASTDTDAGGRYYIQVKGRRPGHKKMTYMEASESEPAEFVRIRRKSKKAEPLPERIVLRDRSVQTESTNSQTTIVDEKSAHKEDNASKAIQTSELVREKPDTDDKENIATHRSQRKPKHRISSFFVDFNNGEKLTKNPRTREHKHESVAWYEPFRYEPAWLHKGEDRWKVSTKTTTCTEDREEFVRTKGLVPLTLQEALVNQNPEFISRSRERQRRIAIHSDERRLQEIWEEERQRIFGARSETKPKRSEPPPRRSQQLTRRQIIAETREKYEQLPEVVKKREEERRKREYASYRLKAQLYKKKVQNKVLGRYFA